MRIVIDWLCKIISKFLRNTRKEDHEFCFIRIGNINNWKRNEDGLPVDIKKARNDFQLRNYEKNLSIYKIENSEEKDLISVYYSVFIRDKPRNFDYIFFQKSLLSGFEVLHAPVPTQPKFLSDRHHEIVDPSESDLINLVDKISRCSNCRVERKRKKEIVDKAIELNLDQHIESQAKISEEWLNAIERRRQNSI